MGAAPVLVDHGPQSEGGVMRGEHVPSGSADERLAVYGTLAPGRPNHHQLAGLRGWWTPGTVRGRLAHAGWAASSGYPGLVLDPAARTIEVQPFESGDLPAHWPRLDRFEGADYRRVLTKVSTADGDVPAWIYVISAADQPPPRPRP